MANAALKKLTFWEHRWATRIQTCAYVRTYVRMYVRMYVGTYVPTSRYAYVVVTVAVGVPSLCIGVVCAGQGRTALEWVGLTGLGWSSWARVGSQT